jgi:hypothetical protein
MAWSFTVCTEKLRKPACGEKFEQIHKEDQRLELEKIPDLQRFPGALWLLVLGA